MVKKPTLKRVTAMLLSVILFFSGFIPTKVNAASTTYVSFQGGLNWTSKASFSFPKTGEPGTARESHSFSAGEHHYLMRATNNGDVLYCIMPGVSLDNSTDMIEGSAFWKNMTVNQRKAIALAVYYGYPQNSSNKVTTDPTNQEIATQLIIWEIVCGYRKAISPYDCTNNCFINGMSGHSGVKNEYNAIVSAMKHHTDIMSFAKTSPTRANANPITLTWDGSKYSKTITDTNGVLTSFTAPSKIGDLTLSKSGNKLTVSTTKAISSGSPTSVKAVHPLRDGTTTAQSGNYGIIPYSASGKQDTISPNGAKPDPTPAYFSFVTEATGSLKVEKKYKRSHSDTTNLSVEKWVRDNTEFYIKNSKGKYIQADLTDSTTKIYSYTSYTSDSSEATLFTPNSGTDYHAYYLTVTKLPPDTYTVVEKNNKHNGFYLSSSNNVNVVVSSGNSGGVKVAAFTNSTVNLTINKSFIQYGAVTDDDYAKVAFELHRYAKDSNGVYQDTGAISVKCIDSKNNVYQWLTNGTTESGHTTALKFVTPSVHSIKVVGLPVNTSDGSSYYQYELLEKSADGSNYVSQRYSYNPITKTLTANSNTINASNPEKNGGSIEIQKDFKVNNAGTIEDFKGDSNLTLTQAYNDISFYVRSSTGKYINATPSYDGTEYYYNYTGYAASQSEATKFKIQYSTVNAAQGKAQRTVIKKLPFGKYTVMEVVGATVKGQGFNVEGSASKTAETKYNLTTNAATGGSVKFTNIKEISAGLKIYKTFVDDENNEIEVSRNMLSNISFAILDKDGNNVHFTADDRAAGKYSVADSGFIYCSFGSDENYNNITITGLTAGKEYYVKEIIPTGVSASYLCCDSYTVVNGTVTTDGGTVSDDKTNQTTSVIKIPDDISAAASAYFTNKQRSVSFNIEKTAFDDRVERKFKVSSTNYTSFEPIYITTEKTVENGKVIGKATVTNLPVAYVDYVQGQATVVQIQYQIEEIETPECYEQPAVQVITPNEDGSSKVTFNNAPKQGSIKVIKKAEVNGSTEIIPFPDITFELTSDFDSNFKKTATTDSNGEILFDKLPSAYTAVDENGNEYIKPVTYTVHEVGNANNAAYVLADDQTTTIDYTESDAAKRVSEVLVINKPIVGNVMLDKADSETGELLSGAVFTLYKDVNGNGKYDAGTDTEAYGYFAVDNGTVTTAYTKSGTMKETIVTVTDDDSNTTIQGKGHYELPNIPKGKYILKETKAPDNYVLDSTKEFAFEISEDAQTIKLYEQKDSADSTKLNKVVDYGNKLVITKSDGTIETVDISDETTSDEEQVVYNTPKTGSVSVIKADSEDKDIFLSGALFNVYKDTNGDNTFDDTDTHIGSMTEVIDADGNGTGQYTIDNLRIGHYLLIESAAPDGYVRTRTVFHFDIMTDNEKAKVYYYKTDKDGNFITDKNGNLIKIHLDGNNVIPNPTYYKFTLPETGGTANMLLITISLAAILLVTGVIFLAHQKRKQ